jgi:hypothetical protein
MLCPMSIIPISNRQAGAPVMNIQSSRHTNCDLSKHFSLAVLFGSNGISYTVFTQSYMRMYTYSSQARDAGRAKIIKIFETAMKAARQGNLSWWQFGHACHRFFTLDLDKYWTTGKPVFHSLERQRSLSSP